MKKENSLLVLWIIFGFIFIEMINSLLHLFIVLTFELGFAFSINPTGLKISIPIISILLYLGTAFLLAKIINTKSQVSGIYLTEFPKTKLFLIFLTTIILVLLTRITISSYTPFITNIEPVLNEYFEAKYWMNVGLIVSKFSTLILLSIIYYLKLKKQQDG